MAGRARGEEILVHRGEELPMLLTNRALADIEQATGKTIVQLAQAAKTGDLGVSDVAEMLRAGLEYGRRDAKTRSKAYTMADVWDIMDEQGFVTCLKCAINAVASVLSFRVTEGESSDPT